VSLAGAIETPLVIHVAQRPGPATGLPTRTEQGDLNLAIHAGHGDFLKVVLSPGDLEGGFTLAHTAFDIADRYQSPVFILSDQYYVDSYYTVEPFKVPPEPLRQSLTRTSSGYRRYALGSADGISPRGIPGDGEGIVCVDSDEHDEGGYITEDRAVREAMVAKRLAKITAVQKDAIPPRLYGDPNYTTLLNTVKSKIIEEMERVFFPIARDFSIGTKLRPEGRAPYFHLLYWLSMSSDWSINLYDIVIKHPKFRGSINQVVDKGYLQLIIEGNNEIKKVIHFDKESRIVSIEDPKFLFYIQNILWSKFGERLGFLNIEVLSAYDFALSFAGEQRKMVEQIFEQLTEHELAVFYDKNEQERILAENVEDYLAPIYKSEADYVVVFLSKDYPKKIWTQFESKQFKERFGEKAVIPVWYNNVEPSLFDESRKYGGITFDVSGDCNKQIDEIVDVLVNKIREHRKKT